MVSGDPFRLSFLKTWYRQQREGPERALDAITGVSYGRSDRRLSPEPSVPSCQISLMTHACLGPGPSWRRSMSPVASLHRHHDRLPRTRGVEVGRGEALLGIGHDEPVVTLHEETESEGPGPARHGLGP